MGIYGRPDFSGNIDEDGKDRLGYNPAIECHGITRADFERVRAKEHSDYIVAEAKL